jgi:hypothetical protein
MEYKVIPLALSGKGKRMFKDGDIVTENDFPSGAIPDLIKGGYLEEIVKEAPVVKEKPVVKASATQKPKPTTKKSTSTKKR